MRILHVTDLHITDSTTSLDALWEGLQVLLKPSPAFDFVVVSGDLVQAAHEPESYAVVKRFLSKRMLPLLAVPDLSRIVIVPGNHDVDWSKPPGKKVNHRELAPQGLARLEAFLREPAVYIESRKQPQWRAKQGIHGIEELFHIDDGALYAERFRAFQSFARDFYDDSLKLPSRMFDLLSPDDGNHWSGHVFPNERVAIYGFSSCHHNDRYWRGASVSTTAIVSAARHAAEHARDHLLIAVFHHGAQSMRGEPDHLTTAELGHFANAGFHVGLHGHTHRDELADYSYELRRKFPIVATGSFAAGPNERADGERNQASILDLNRNSIHWTLLNRTRNEQWSIASRKMYSMPVIGPESDVDHMSDLCSVERHLRAIEIRPDGIATVTITLQGVELDRELLLACPERRSNAMVADEKAEIERLGHRTYEKVINRGTSGSPIFVLMGTPKRVDQIVFRYHIANAFALDAIDLAHMRRPSFAGELGLDVDEDAWVYTPRVPTRQLTMTIKYPEHSMLDAATGRAQEHVGNEVLREPASKWRDHEREIKHIGFSHDTDTATLNVSDPRPGVRYALKYRLGACGRRQPLDDKVQHVLGDVSRQCRTSTDPYLRDFIKNFVGKAIVKTLEVQASAQDTWTAHLWNAAHNRLEPAFGAFPPIAWGRDFEYGEGVVGHAFRIRGPAVYHQETGPSARLKYPSWLIYQGRGAHAHHWVVCVPILARPSVQFGALGVIGFALPQGATPTALQRKLEHMARNYAMDPPATHQAEEVAGDRDPLTRLMLNASYIFWQSLLRADGLDGHRKFIRRFIDDHWRVQVKSDVAPKPEASVKQSSRLKKRRKR